MAKENVELLAIRRVHKALEGLTATQVGRVLNFVNDQINDYAGDKHVEIIARVSTGSQLGIEEAIEQRKQTADRNPPNQSTRTAAANNGQQAQHAVA